jgi:aspartate-semialdehyde dehydrogenase
MATPLVGLVGWRGMVGSVLMQRMQDEGDFAFIEPVFFSTSNAGGPAPAMAKNEKKLYSADDIDALKRSSLVKVAITPRKFIQRFVRLVGKVIGLMRPVPCAWLMSL